MNHVICSISSVKNFEFPQLPLSPRASFEDVLESIVIYSISSVRRNTSQSDQTGKYCLLTEELLQITMDSSTSPKLALGLSGNCWNSQDLKWRSIGFQLFPTTSVGSNIMYHWIFNDSQTHPVFLDYSFLSGGPVLELCGRFGSLRGSVQGGEPATAPPCAPVVLFRAGWYANFKAPMECPNPDGTRLAPTH